jgi:putative transposase
VEWVHTIIHVNKGRFASQALLDEKALLTCMAYVDLNPIRAGMVKSLKDSDYTAIQSRIRASQGQTPPLPLLPFEDQLETTDQSLPYNLRHYLKLVDWTGRAVRDDKRSAIPAESEPILDRLGFD